jgi:hypothetical protein
VFQGQRREPAQERSIERRCVITVCEARNAYLEALAPAEKAYDEAKAAAEKTYEEALAPGPQGLP